MPTLYLAHYGTKGQKWGRRRWQNLDGSLTPEGREHYGVGEPRGSSGEGAAKSGNTQSSGHPIWGVRRYKNSDGPSTPEGKERSGAGEAKSSSDEDAKKAKPKKFDYSNLTTAEINERINRLNKEAELAKLEALQNMGPLKRRAYQMIQDAGADALKDVSKKALTRLGEKAIQKLTGIDMSSNDKQGNKQANKQGNNNKKQNTQDEESDALRRKRRAEEELARRKAERALKEDRAANPENFLERHAVQRKQKQEERKKAQERPAKHLKP